MFPELLSSPEGQALGWTGEAKLNNSLIPVEMYSQIGEVSRDDAGSVGWEVGTGHMADSEDGVGAWWR